MKLTKKFVAAIGLCALSACMLVTSTFAWFSMNVDVTATGMSVTAVGDQVYLQIVAGASTTEFKNGVDQTTASASASTAELFPVNVKADSSWGNYAGGNTFVWAKATGTAPDNGAIKGQYSEAANTNTVKYYLENSFMIRLDPTAGASNASGPLTVSGVKFATGYTANDLGATVCVLVVCGTNSQLWTQDATAGTFAKKAGNDYLDADEVANALGGKDTVFTDKTGVEVKVYVFFNGDHANCTLQNLAKLNTDTNKYPIEVSFTVKGA